MSRPGRSLPPGKDLVPIVQEVGWAPDTVWTGAKNLAPTGIRCPDRPARSRSLYRLRYPAHPKPVIVVKLIFVCSEKFSSIPVLVVSVSLILPIKYSRFIS